MKKFLCMAAAAVLLFVSAGCNRHEALPLISFEGMDMAHNSQNSLDWAGVYQGILPCADCEGFDTVITLNWDET